MLKMSKLYSHLFVMLMMMIFSLFFTVRLLITHTWVWCLKMHSVVCAMNPLYCMLVYYGSLSFCAILFHGKPNPNLGWCKTGKQQAGGVPSRSVERLITGLVRGIETSHNPFNIFGRRNVFTNILELMLKSCFLRVNVKIFHFSKNRSGHWDITEGHSCKRCAFLS